MTVDDDVTALREKAKAKAAEKDEKSQNWNPEVGDELIGTMKRGKVVTTRRGTKVRLIVVEEAGTQELYTVWCSSKILEDWTYEEAPAVGSTVLISYHGKRAVKADPSIEYNVYEAAATESDQAYWADLEAAWRAKDSAGAEAAQHGETPTTFGPNEAPF